jgi:predicted ArsR family transcriptional regulator
MIRRMTSARAARRMDAIRQALLVKPMDAAEVAAEIGANKRWIINYLQKLHAEGKAHIAQWKWERRGGAPRPVYSSWPGEDAPRPAPTTKAEKERARRAKYRKAKPAVMAAAPAPEAKAPEVKVPRKRQPRPRQERCTSPNGQIMCDRIIDLFNEKPRTVREIAQALRAARSTAGTYVTYLRTNKRIYVAEWRPGAGKGRFSPVYAAGDCEDAPEPQNQRVGKAESVQAAPAVERHEWVPRAKEKPGKPRAPQPVPEAGILTAALNWIPRRAA